jgi:hypothetical protein
MLKALDEDPKRCGYSDEQIDKGLDALTKQSIKQLGSDAAQLFHILLNKKLIDENEHTLKLAKEHPEIVQLRFDRERSNLEDIPKYIREPLFRIFTQYSEGAVQLKDRKWHTFVFDEEQLNIPYFLIKENENNN